MADRIRIGILGAARIAPAAIVKPAKHVSEADLVSVAARDPGRAASFATKHAIPAAHVSYEALVADPDVDAVYIPLPNGLHAEWATRALESGKHVLCEKPLTNNAREALTLEALAEAKGLRLMEAFHYRYHPVAKRMLEIVESGELGSLETVETWVCFPLPRFSDIRYQYDLGGGALMDAGCYAVHMARLLGGADPEVVGAQAKLRGPDIDRAMRAELRFDGGHKGTVTCSMWSRDLLHIGIRVTGSNGTLRVFNPLMPHMYHRISVSTGAGSRGRGRGRGPSRVEHLSKRPTYEFQLEAFCSAVLRGEEPLTPPSDSVSNMKVIDAIYQAAGMRLRGT